ncbi:hypothetical protein FRB99_006934 [Tulasnella sp. 403]|nr:hypothetical protein FRB99_006934 [Tulasnella sp. 403]
MFNSYPTSSQYTHPTFAQPPQHEMSFEPVASTSKTSLTVQQPNPWPSSSKTSPSPNSSSTESSLAGAMGNPTMAQPQPQQQYAPIPVPVVSAALPSHSASSLSSALIVPRTSRHYQSHSPAPSHPHLQHAVPQNPPSSTYFQSVHSEHIANRVNSAPFDVQSSPQHAVNTFSDAQVVYVQHPPPQQQWYPAGPVASSHIPQSMIRSVQTPTSMHPPINQRQDHLQGVLSPAQQQTLALATHAASPQPSTGALRPSSSHGPQHTFLPIQSQTLNPVQHRVQTFPVYNAPQHAQFQVQQPHPNVSSPQPQQALHYTQMQQQPFATQQQQQCYYPHHTLVPYGVPTPGSSGVASPSSFAGGIDGEDREVEQIIGRSEGLVRQDGNYVVGEYSYSPEAQSYPGSDSSGANSLPTPAGTPGSANRLDQEGYDGQRRTNQEDAFEYERATHAARELIFINAQVAQAGRNNTAPKANRSGGAAESSKSSSKRAPGTFTFVGGPSRRAAAAAALQSDLLPSASGQSRKRASAQGSDAEEEPNKAKRRTRRRANRNFDDSDDGGEDFEARDLYFGGSLPSPLATSSSFAAMFPHVHIINIPCPHPLCAFTAAADGIQRATTIGSQQGGKKKGKGISKPYSCTYIHPVSGIRASHSGTESKEVTNGSLDLSLARRLLWDTCRVIEQGDWACLYRATGDTTDAAQLKVQMASGEISSHQAAASVYVSKDEALQRITHELDTRVHGTTMDVLVAQSQAVKSLIVAEGDAEQQLPKRTECPFVSPINLQGYACFCIVAMQRADTFERYFCPEKGCNVNFTRLDALLRHGKNSHGEGGKKERKRGPTGARQSLKKASSSRKKGKKRVEEDSESESEEDGWPDEATDDGNESEER